MDADPLLTRRTSSDFVNFGFPLSRAPHSNIHWMFGFFETSFAKVPECFARGKMYRGAGRELNGN